MHTLDNNYQERTRSCDMQRSRNLFLGITLVVAGVLWLLKNFRVLPYETFDLIFSWPTLLVVIGGYLLSLRRWVSGGIVGGLGICLLIADIAGMAMPAVKLLLPLLCVGAGIATLLHRKS